MRSHSIHAAGPVSVKTRQIVLLSSGGEERFQDKLSRYCLRHQRSSLASGTQPLPGTRCHSSRRVLGSGACDGRLDSSPNPHRSSPLVPDIRCLTVTAKAVVWSRANELKAAFVNLSLRVEPGKLSSKKRLEDRKPFTFEMVTKFAALVGRRGAHP